MEVREAVREAADYGTTEPDVAKISKYVTQRLTPGYRVTVYREQTAGGRVQVIANRGHEWFSASRKVRN